jgi:hypothetical protein
LRTVVSHISRKTSEIPEFPVRVSIQRQRVRLSLKESRMKFNEPSELHRKFGGMGHPEVCEWDRPRSEVCESDRV